MQDGVINSAKQYARENGKSLSDIVENYLKSLTKPERSIDELSPRVARLRGMINLPKDFDYKKEIEKAIIKKVVC
jgi:hypothetical protein